MNTLKTATSLLLGVLGSSPVLAAPTNAQTLGVGEASATDGNNIDGWQLVCVGSNTSAARARVTDTNTINNPNAQMKVDVSDFNSGGVGIALVEGATSGWAVAGGGQGVFDVDFSKSASGDESYSGEALCDGGAVQLFTKTQDQ